MEGNELDSSRKRVARLLRLVFEGKLSAKEAREKWPDKGSTDNDLNYAFHILYYFEEDGYTRDRNEAYAKWQKGEIKNMISKLSQSEAS